MLIFDFFVEKKNDQKSRNLDMFSQTDYKIDSRSFWIVDRNDSQIRVEFFDKRGFRKLEKVLKKFICIRINGQINIG